MLFVFLLAFSSAEAQKIVGKVTEKTSNQGLSFVQIGVKGKSIGVLSNAMGNFEFSNKQISAGDSLVFNYLGYEPLVVAVEKVVNKKNLIIPLQKTIYALPEISVSANAFNKLMTFGYKNTKAKRITTGWTSTYDSTGHKVVGNSVGERGSLMKFKGRTVLLKNLHFHVANSDYDSVLFRVHLYTVKDDLPDKEITPANIFVRTATKFGFVKVPLSSYQIVAEEDVIATIEWVKAWRPRSEGTFSLHFSIGLFGGLVWRDYRHQPNWQRSKTWHPGIYLDGLVATNKTKN
ncbi:MAG: carboxypeptidase-like regulatory domain-containing protein [Bacteroidota bacterium]